jgi:hypothetical protein
MSCSKWNITCLPRNDDTLFRGTQSILSATEQLLFCLGDAATSGALYIFV